ncbi:acetyl-CoA C-acetyltransferase [Dactylosporangium aurantiacum]|uniref:Acetyl-CoA C-acetyltransferase n=1 Tax=Dactylosporangium aurantiacum TaxID=35754 RepID=A0A9Q9I782_9ACTN|nr:acetyl-CoA C-acetyltransferase [Dactylosporangium aurantiacum]MDG6106376.1 acetyl-CoA C-acetyltransferase [Dactylosporangium aurantiacum]UWZ50582.1 acetyl-CoA C-acetyltransferase [Dactylosporangium aurantiacum]
MPEAVIVSAVRSPIGRAHKGSLTGVRADDLAAQIVRLALDRVPALDPRTLDDLMLGCAQPAGEQGYNLGRQVAMQLGYDMVPGTTVNRYCASSLQAIRMAFHAIKAGEGHAFVAAGVEVVSHYAAGKADGMPGTRNPRFDGAGGARPGVPWSDPRERGELPDVYIAMGETAENVAELCGISRREQDEFAVRSQNNAEKALADGFWERDITPVTLPDGTVLRADDGPRAGVTLDKVAALQPAFRPDGTVTAGNCCPLNDGAAALVVLSDTRARELGLTPLARIVSTGVSALSPEIMGLGPVEASRRALANAGMAIGDIDLVEINEAFAAQVIPAYRQIGADLDRVNVHGGAIAVGHPFGMTGARIATTLLNGLVHRDAQFGLETMCTAGGQGMAMIVERLS